MALAPGAENPSAAYLAGAQHGTRLAIQHHVNPPAAKPAAKPTASPVRKPAANTGSSTSTLNSVLAQANQMAAADTTAQVNAIKQQQGLLTTQASQRAQQINLASQAAAEFLTGLGDKTAASYSTAGKDLAAIAQGYSGQTRTDATSAADQVAANLALLGAPAGSAKTATGQTVQPEALSNVLYGLGGAMPSSTLINAGQLQAGVQRGLPASMLGYGQQQAAGTLAAGQQQAQNLLPQILNAQAGRSKLAQQYLAALQSQITNSALANSLISSRTGALTIQQQNANTAALKAANSAHLGQQRLAQQQANADRNYQLALNKVNTADQPSANASLSKSLGYVVDGTGAPLLQDGKKILIPKTASAATKGPLGLSAKEYQRQTALALGAARTYHSTWQDANGKNQPPLSWQEYLTHGERAGTSIAILIKQGKKVYSAKERKLGLRPGG